MRIFNLKDAFKKESGVKFFLLSVLITGLSYGLYKGVIDNYLAEIVGMGEMARNELRAARGILTEEDHGDLMRRLEASSI